jgi:hypothetical protein
LYCSTLQHSNIKNQEKYLPIIRQAYKNGEIDSGKLALLEDRVAIRQGKRQIYGTQVKEISKISS